jgi:hypothetical protein
MKEVRKMIDKTEMFIIFSIGFSAVIMVILSMAIITFGKLIAKTPDGEERRGEKVRDESAKTVWHSPERMPKIFVMSFWTIYIIGSLVLLLSTPRVAILGGAAVISALIFSATIAALEIISYNLMCKNVIELKGSIVA